MAQEYWNSAFKAANLPQWFFVMRPEAAMAHAALSRQMRELNIWRMAAALQIDMAATIKSGVLTRDAPLDLLQSMTRRCAACDMQKTCRTLLQATSDRLSCPPDFCRIKNRLWALVPDEGPSLGTVPTRGKAL